MQDLAEVVDVGGEGGGLGGEEIVGGEGDARCNVVREGRESAGAIGDGIREVLHSEMQRGVVRREEHGDLAGGAADLGTDAYQRSNRPPRAVLRIAMMVVYWHKCKR